MEPLKNESLKEFKKALSTLIEEAQTEEEVQKGSVKAVLTYALSRLKEVRGHFEELYVKEFKRLQEAGVPEEECQVKALLELIAVTYLQAEQHSVEAELDAL